MVYFYKHWTSKHLPAEYRHHLSGGNRGVSTLLVVLPDSARGVKIADRILKPIVANQAETKNISLCCAKHNVSDHDNFGFSEIIAYDDSDKDRWGFPLQSFITRVNRHKFEAIVDLNYDFNPFSTWLIRSIESPVRIGFNSLYADDVFNIIFDRNETSLLENDYKKIFEVLGL
jgi:hypothetical protein